MISFDPTKIISIRCSKCLGKLEIRSETSAYNRREYDTYITPCQHCLALAKQEGQKPKEKSESENVSAIVKHITFHIDNLEVLAALLDLLKAIGTSTTVKENVQDVIVSGDMKQLVVSSKNLKALVIVRHSKNT